MALVHIDGVVEHIHLVQVKGVELGLHRVPVRTQFSKVHCHHLVSVLVLFRPLERIVLEGYDQFLLVK